MKHSVIPSPNPELANEFRIVMTEGQTMKEHNEFRRRFYQQVVRIAEKLVAEDVPHLESNSGPSYTSPPTSKDALDYNFFPAASCHKLVGSLKARKQHSSSSPVKKKATSKAGRVSRKTEDDYPLVIRAFDEAHTLTNREDTGCAVWSNFGVLGHVFRALYRFPLFALFLSTTDKISQFTSPDEDLSFNTLAKQSALDGRWNLERVTAIVYMARPLFGSHYNAGDRSVRGDIVMFAAGKLLNADLGTRDLIQHQMLACLSQRSPIQFNSTAYISQTAERKEVEGRMRVRLKIDAAFESMETVSSSEPLLSEAAYVIMARKSFDPLKSFKSVLEGFAVYKGCWPSG